MVRQEALDGQLSITDVAENVLGVIVADLPGVELLETVADGVGLLLLGAHGCGLGHLLQQGWLLGVAALGFFDVFQLGHVLVDVLLVVVGVLGVEAGGSAQVYHLTIIL